MNKYLFPLIGLLLVSCSQPVVSTKHDDTINFAMEICLEAGVEKCGELHERWLPSDVLAEELYGKKHAELNEGESIGECPEEDPCHGRQCALYCYCGYVTGSCGCKCKKCPEGCSFKPDDSFAAFGSGTSLN